MRSRAVSPRMLLLAAVVAMHAGMLLVLLAETRTRTLRSDTPASALFVLLLEPRERQAPAAPKRPGMRSPTARPEPSAEAAVSAPVEPAPDAAIDWAAEARAAATRLIEADELRTRRVRALRPKPSPMFARAPRRAPGIAWDYAATHRVEPLGGLATVIHLNDRCAIVLFLIIPFAGGCALEKPPARGDLLEHMHDPDPAPEP